MCIQHRHDSYLQDGDVSGWLSHYVPQVSVGRPLCAQGFSTLWCSLSNRKSVLPFKGWVCLPVWKCSAFGAVSAVGGSEYFILCHSLSVPWLSVLPHTSWSLSHVPLTYVRSPVSLQFSSLLTHLLPDLCFHLVVAPDMCRPLCWQLTCSSAGSHHCVL